jgi:hypothetical protein
MYVFNSQWPLHAYVAYNTTCRVDIHQAKAALLAMRVVGPAAY